MTIGIWGAGFIGRGILAALINRGVYDLCLLTRGSERSIKVAGMEIPVRHMPFESSSEQMSVALAGLSVLIHCSGNPRDEFEEYLVATKRMAKAAAKLSVPRVVYVSTVGVYGDAVPDFGVGQPVTIGTDVIPRPKSEYAKSRFKAECEMRHIFSKSCVDFVTIRIPMVVGVGMSSNVFWRLRRLFDFRIQPQLGGVSQTFLPCIGVEHLSNLVATISLEKSTLNGLFQFSEKVYWSGIIQLCKGNRSRFLFGLSVRRLYKFFLLLKLERLSTFIRPMLNTVSYADDSKMFFRETDKKLSADQCVFNVIENLKLK